jgi:predicted nuclease of predicted toxin-antitoxin system
LNLIENRPLPQAALTCACSNLSCFDLGAPPQVIWLTRGNTSNARLREILSVSLEKALNLIEAGETLVEISSI